MAKILQITPFLHVGDLEEALDLLTRVLGFEVKFRLDNYVYLEHEGAGLRVLEEPGRPLPSQGQARMTVYLDVSDVDTLFARLLPELNTLPPGDVEPPMDKPWDQREFHVRLPDGNWVAFGQPVKPN